MTLRLLPLALALLAGSASADLFKDPQWQTWLDAGKTADLTRAAQARAKAQPDDDQAAIALAMTAIDDNDGARLEASVPALQACADKRPSSANLAACSYALGRVYGQQAMSASVFRMPGLAAKTKEQFAKAVELDPQLLEARIGLAQFYLIAPGFAGGSEAKARELASGARQPEQGRLVRFLIAAQDKDWTSAEKELASIKPGDDRGLQRELRNSWMRLGAEMLEQKSFAKAKGIFEGLQRDFPHHAAGPYGLGRVALDTQQPDEALRLLERARTLEGADRFPIDHRVGHALVAKGDKAGARLAFERVVNNKRSHPRIVEDARKQLAELG